MNNAGRAAAGPWSYPDCGAGGEPAVAVTAAAAGYTSSFVADVIADYSTDDLFELVWEQGGGASGSSAMQPPASRLWSPPAAVEEERFDPPSEGEMAAWLCAIVKGEELIAFNDDGDGRQQTAADGRRDVPAAAKGSSDDTSTMTDTKEKLAISEATSTKQEMRKPGAGRSSRRSHHHGEVHSLTEKRRRHKINEKLRTLQQLVPGCDNSNQALTLDKTIQYMKSLQNQVDVMSDGSAHPPPPPPPAAAYPFMPPQYVPPAAPVAVPMPTAAMVLGASPPAMVPFGAMVQLPQYPLMMPAAPASLYPAAAPPTPMAPAVAPGGAGSSARHGQAYSSSRKGKGSSSSMDLRQPPETLLKLDHQEFHAEFKQD